MGVEAFRVEGGAEASGVEAFGVEDFLGVPGLGLEGLGGGVEAFGGESVASSPQTFWASCPLSTTRCRPEDEAPPVGSGLFGTIVVVVVVVESFGGGFSGVPFSFPVPSSSSTSEASFGFDFFFLSRVFLLGGSSTSSREETGVVSCSWSRRSSRDFRSFLASSRQHQG